MIFSQLFIAKSKYFLFAGISLLLISCGGGGLGGPCGSASQSFGISFDATYSLKVGIPATLQSSVTPESCRSDMTFALYTLTSPSTLPAGMSLVSGNVVGTPSQAGTYRFSIAITAVSNYSPLYLGTQPHSATVTVTVAP